MNPGLSLALWGGALVCLALLAIGVGAFFVFPKDEGPEAVEAFEEWIARIRDATGFPDETIVQVLDLTDDRRKAAAICEACALVGECPVASAKSVVELERKNASFEEWLADFIAWQTATFPGVTPQAVFDHLKEEVAELSDALDDPGEIADCLLLLCALANHFGIDPVEAMRAKDQVNRGRVWVRKPEGFRHE